MLTERALKLKGCPRRRELKARQFFYASLAINISQLITTIILTLDLGSMVIALLK